MYLPVPIPTSQKPRKTTAPKQKFAMKVLKRLLEICSNVTRSSALSGQTQATSVTLKMESDVSRFLIVKIEQNTKYIFHQKHFYISTKNRDNT